MTDIVISHVQLCKEMLPTNLVRTDISVNVCNLFKSKTLVSWGTRQWVTISKCKMMCFWRQRITEERTSRIDFHLHLYCYIFNIHALTFITEANVILKTKDNSRIDFIYIYWYIFNLHASTFIIEENVCFSKMFSIVTFIFM